MKNKLVFLLITLLCFLGTAHATLINSGNGIIQDNRGTTDTADDLFWLQNLAEFTNQTYSAQITAIGALSGYDAGLNDWHMANYTEMAALWSYDASTIIQSFYPSYQYEGDYYFSGRYDVSSQSIDSHFIAEASHLTAFGPADPKKDPLNTYDIADSFSTPASYWQSSVGAWVVATNSAGIPNNPPAVPEPSTFLLLGSGLAGLGLYVRRRKKI